jgi:hypothetical protein
MPQGGRHRRRATAKVNGGRAKGRIDAMEHRPCQMNLRKQFFFARKAAARGVNLNLRVDVIGRFGMVKNKARDVESVHVHGAPLKRTAERIKCVSRAII